MKLILSLFICSFFHLSLLLGGQDLLDAGVAVKPYLLPDDHPIKNSLDAIFSTSRATLSIETMKKAGFVNAVPRKFTRLVVASHPKIPNYIFKLYLDAQRYHKDQPEHVFWIRSIEGAYAIRRIVDQNNWNHLFIVPNKWIYPLPAEPSPPEEFQRKNYILVEDDMNLLSSKENKKAWKSSKVNEDLLKNLYVILKKNGLHDCAKIDNLPFTKDGKIAFIDTQSYQEGSVPFKRLTAALSPEMKKRWKKIVKRDECDGCENDNNRRCGGTCRGRFWPRN